MIFFARTVEDELHDGVDGLVARADAEQLDDVLVIEALHHFGLAEEVDLLLDRRADFERFDGHGHLDIILRLRFSGAIGSKRHAELTVIDWLRPHSVQSGHQGRMHEQD